jgi:hypothetical protein
MGIFSDNRSIFEGVFARMAESVTYNGADIPGSVTYGEDPAARAGRPGVMAEAELEVLRRDVSAPAYRDTVLIDGATWRVRYVITGDEWGWRLAISNDERLGR